MYIAHILFYYFSFGCSKLLIIFFLNFISNSLSGNQFYHGMVTEGNEYALIFISPGILPALRNGREMHIDATFCIVPHLFYQLLTMHVIAYGQVIII